MIVSERKWVRARARRRSPNCIFQSAESVVMMTERAFDDVKKCDKA